MFDLLYDLNRLKTGAFIQSLQVCKQQETRKERQLRMKKQSSQEFLKSVEAIKCPHAFEHVCKKWGWD